MTKKKLRPMDTIRFMFSSFVIMNFMYFQVYIITTKSFKFERDNGRIAEKIFPDRQRYGLGTTLTSLQIWAPGS